MSESRLHLASASPRRRMLIQQLGMPVTVGVASVDEMALEAQYLGPPEGLGEYLAARKTEAAARALPTGEDSEDVLVVGADTTVILDNRVLGKPADVEEAEWMLRALRGREHLVVTGVALARPGAHDLRGTSVATRVFMRPFADEEIARYVATGDPLDKAGAYGVQHPDFQPVARIAGCYTAVVGLPLCAVAGLIGALTGATPEPRKRATACPWSDRCQAPLSRWATACAR